jgi:hypothetical protein
MRYYPKRDRDAKNYGEMGSTAATGLAAARSAESQGGQTEKSKKSLMFA